MNKLVRCAIVGLGRIGSILEDDTLREKPCTHAGAIADNPDCLLVGGSDTSPERRQLFSERWKTDAVWASAEDLLRYTRPDILHIATHPDSHLYYADLASRFGVPVAVCEKPLADSLAKARKIVRLQSSGKIIILTNHERRYSADYRHTRQIILEKRYGDLLSVSARMYFGRKRKIIDQLVHDGTHLVDIISFLIGGPLAKASVEGNLGTAKTAFITARGGPGKIPVVIETGGGRDYLVFEISLSFSGGRIDIGNGIFSEYASKKSPHYEGFRSLQPCPPVNWERTDYFRNMMKDAVLCARNPGQTPVSTASDGFSALKFIMNL